MEEQPKVKIVNMNDNQANQQMPQVDLTKCCDCLKPFTKGQEYHELYREKIVVMCFCVECYKKYHDKKKVWEK